MEVAGTTAGILASDESQVKESEKRMSKACSLPKAGIFTSFSARLLTILPASAIILVRLPAMCRVARTQVVLPSIPTHKAQAVQQYRSLELWAAYSAIHGKASTTTCNGLQAPN